MKKKLVLGITSPGSGPLIKGQAKYFHSLGYSVYLMAPDDERIKKYCNDEKCFHIPINIKRDIHFFKDLFSLLKIYFALRKLKPDIVNVGTPKIGLLGSIAAALLGVKKRIYICRGFIYEHESGLKKKILMLAEKIASACVHHVVCISKSLEERGVQDGVFSANKTIVIGKGSSNGVDLTRFNPDTILLEKKNKVRHELQLNNKFVFGFIGRLINRKGIKELYLAFEQVNKKHPNTALIILGSITKGQFSDEWLLEKFNEHPNIHWLGFQEKVPLYLSVFDVLVLPAWWEGFGNVLIQAAAMGVPVISTKVTGCSDAVNNGFNGTLIPAKDVDALLRAMLFYMDNEELRTRHGNNGKKWAQNFSPEKVWLGLDELYNS